MQQEIKDRYEQLRDAEFLSMAAAKSLRKKVVGFCGLGCYDDPVGMYLSGSYEQSRAFIDMCILNNHGSENNLNSNSAYTLVIALDCYYKQLERIKLLKTQIETLQALIDSSL
jgi:hypothetical protein